MLQKDHDLPQMCVKLVPRFLLEERLRYSTDEPIVNELASMLGKVSRRSVVSLVRVNNSSFCRVSVKRLPPNRSISRFLKTVKFEIWPMKLLFSIASVRKRAGARNETGILPFKLLLDAEKLCKRGKLDT